MKIFRIKQCIPRPTIFVAAFLLLTLTAANAQAPKLKYNKQLADSLGADDYGMKMYVLVIIKPGKVKIEDKHKADSLFAGHLKNIGELAKAGKLVAAGPIKKNDKSYDGIFILNVNRIDAEKILETDPAIKAKILDPEIFEWYGSAALPLYLRFHESVKKKDF